MTHHSQGWGEMAEAVTMSAQAASFPTGEVEYTHWNQPPIGMNDFCPVFLQGRYVPASPCCQHTGIYMYIHIHTKSEFMLQAVDNRQLPQLPAGNEKKAFHETPKRFSKSSSIKGRIKEIKCIKEHIFPLLPLSVTAESLLLTSPKFICKG